MSPRTLAIVSDTPLTKAGLSELDLCLSAIGLGRKDVLLDTLPLRVESYTEINCILTLGERALSALTGQTALSRQRGSIYGCTLDGMEGTKVIGTYHLSQIGYGLGAKQEWKLFFLIDLSRAKEQATFSEIPVPHGALLTKPHLSTCLDYLAECREAGKFAHDIEVYGNHISCMSFSTGFDSAICIPFYDGTKPGRSYWSEDEELLIWSAVTDTLGGGYEIIGQNYIFDMSVLLRRNKILPYGTLNDTMIAHSIVYPDHPKGLDVLCSLYTSIPYYKDDLKLWTRLEEGEDKQQRFWEYSARDAVATYLVWEAIREKVEREPHATVYRNSMNLHYPFLYMMDRGIRVDTEVLDAAREETRAELDAAERQLAAASEEPFNYRSPKQCIDYFYGTLGIKAYTQRKTGKPTTDDTAMQRLHIQHGREEARLVGECRKLAKVLGNEFSMELDPDERMRCSINIRGTKFGRVSTSKTIFGTGANMQNLNPRFKPCLVPDPGCVFIELDLSGAEWMVVAYYSQDKAMIDVCESGESPHLVTAHRISGIPKELILAEDAAVGHRTNPSDIRAVREKKVPDILACEAAGAFLPANMSLRQAAKRANHGFNYGLGAPSFALLNNMKATDARQIQELYLQVYPGIKKMHASIQKDLTERRRVLTNCLGRHQKFMGQWDHTLFMSAYAFPAQSTVVDVINTAVRTIWADPDLIQWQPLMQVHDSILFQVEESQIKEVKKVQKHLDIELEYHGRKFKIPSEVKVGKKSWAAMYDLRDDIGEETL